MDISGKGVRQPRVKKIGSSNQDQTNSFLLGKEIIRSVYLTQRKARPEGRYGLTKQLQGQKY